VENTKGVRQLCLRCMKVFYYKDGEQICDLCKIQIEFDSKEKINRKEMKIRNWEDKLVAEQWQRAYRKSEIRILSKCKGCKYSDRLH
jgi:hypothetical protein